MIHLWPLSYQLLTFWTYWIPQQRILYNELLPDLPGNARLYLGSLDDLVLGDEQTGPLRVSPSPCSPRLPTQTALLHLQLELLVVPEVGDVLLASVVLLPVTGGAPDEAISFWLRNLGIVNRLAGAESVGGGSKGWRRTRQTWS
jgi:hypothetical protein